MCVCGYGYVKKEKKREWGDGHVRLLTLTAISHLGPFSTLTLHVNETRP